MTSLRFRIRPLVMAFLGLATLALIATEADARAGRGGSFGSRGSRTYSAPPPTATAPGQARPVERTMTQPGQPGTAVGRPATPGAQPGGLFNRPGLLGGLAAGFLGAGLLGLLFGNGLLGGLGGIASFLGLLLQAGLIALVVVMAWRWWQRRSQPALAGGPSLRDIAPTTSRRDIAPETSGRPLGLGALGGLGGGLGGARAAAPAPAGSDFEIAPADFDVFERLLGEVQAAYGAEDLNALKSRVTPEMLSYFAEDLAANASQGVSNQVSDVKLLQGDLAESWREGGAEYATVAMRFSLVDRTIERASGRVVEGSDTLQEATELWTFMRAPGGTWLLAAIQQT
jgi:predicted lipid-binding transport protein (Tim44 family)